MSGHAFAQEAEGSTAADDTAASEVQGGTVEDAAAAGESAGSTATDESPPQEAQGGTGAAEAPTGGDLSLDQVVDRLQKNYEKVNSYQAGFDQELYSMTQGRVVSRGSGLVIYKKPGRMVWRYREPEEHLYITSGSTIWDYSPVEKEAYLIPMKEALYKSFLLGLGNVRDEFEASFHAGRKKNADGLYQVELVPRDKAERDSLGAITLYVDPDDFLVRSTEMIDALGNRNRITFKDLKTNPELPDSLFVFEPPPGVSVIRADQALQPDR